MHDPLAGPPLQVLPSHRAWPLHDNAATRRLEQSALAATAPHALMQRAGLVLARLAQALAPAGRAVWVAAGPGNNGGDGLVAAQHLHQWGRAVQVSWLGDETRLPDDARDALLRARQAGVAIETGLPAKLVGCGLVIDALLGLGASRAPSASLARAIQLINSSATPVLAADLPSGLAGDTGTVLGEAAVRADHTLSLLTLKPGLFTSAGRDHSGRVWLHDLGVDIRHEPPSAWLGGPAAAAPRRHAQHKGSFGDVLVLGGARGMAGAATLAARAALAAGAGRVLLATLDAADGHGQDMLRPELMLRSPAALCDPALLKAGTVVCGCGGGSDIATVLPTVLLHAGRLVLDADGLNAVAADATLMSALQARAARSQATVLTPHPLEAARLLGCSSTDVQADRLAQAQTLARITQATVVLKGSGSVVATDGQPPVINPSGNARLATAGSGDVLAGWLGGRWSSSSQSAHDSAQAAVWLHGAAAEAGDASLPLRASDLIEALAALHAAAP